MKKLFISLAMLVVFVSFPNGTGAWERSYYWSWGPGGGWAGSFFVIPIILMLGFWIAVIIGIVFLVRWVLATGKKHEMRPEETALDILKKRYAKGEISKEEFETIKHDIQ